MVNRNYCSYATPLLTKKGNESLRKQGQLPNRIRRGNREGFNIIYIMHAVHCINSINHTVHARTLHTSRKRRP